MSFVLPGCWSDGAICAAPVLDLAISVNIGSSKPSLVHARGQIVNNDLLKPLPVHARGDFEHGADFFAGSVLDLAISVNITFSKPAPVHARGQIVNNDLLKPLPVHPRSDFEHGIDYFVAPVHARGDFEHGADMKCSLTNDGPVTIIIDSRIRE